MQSQSGEGMDPHYAVEKMLNIRLEATQAERSVVKESLDNTEAKIKFLSARIGQKPRESEQDIIEQNRLLEYDHSTKPQNNADERKFMRDLDKLKQKKKIVIEYNIMQDELDSLKNQRAVLGKELREKDRVLDDLYQGTRKLKAAMKLGCSAGDVLEKKILVPEEKLSRVIGKGGGNIKQIEADCKVIIDSDRAGHIRIMGKEEEILAAEQKLLIIINTTMEEFSLVEEAIVCLTLGKATLLQEIQSLYGVRIDISKSKRLCGITGLSENIQAAKAEILAIRCARVELPFEDSILPFVIGKGGNTIRALEVDHSVQLDVSRELHMIVVLGFEDDVKAAVATLSNIIHENKEIEEIIEVDRNTVLNCIIGAKGNVIRNLQKELNVYIQTQKTEEIIQKLSIRGTAANVIPAKMKINELIAEYESHGTVVTFPEEILPLIVGRKGARITSLREEHPLVQFDIDNINSCVRIHCIDHEARVAAKSAVEAIVQANQRGEIHMDMDTTIALKGARGLETRTKIVNELSLNLDILSIEEIVRVRGETEAIQIAIKLLETFRENNFTSELPCFDEDANALFGGGENSSGKLIEKKYNVEIFQDRKRGIIRIRGNKDAVDEAEKAISNVLEGGEESGTQLIEVENGNSMSALIGKGGSTIKKFESQHNVHLDILRSRGLVRIRGEPEEVENARRAIMTFIQNNRVSVSILRPKEITASEAFKILTKASSLYFGIDFEQSEFELILRGPQRLIQDAKQYVTEQITGIACCSIALLETQFSALAAQADLNFKQISDTNQIQVEMDASTHSIILNGPTSAVTKAQLQVYRLLDFLFPSEFASIPLDAVSLAEVGSFLFVEEIRENAVGTRIQVNQQLSCVRLRGTPHGVSIASDIIRSRQIEWKKRTHIIPIQEYMIPLLLTKKGSNISTIEKETGASINIDRIALRLIITGPGEEEVKKASQEISSRISKLQHEHWEIVLDERLFGPMIGKQGAHVNKLRAETGAAIDMDAKTYTVKVNGSEEKVAHAKEKILSFIAEQQKENLFHAKIRVPPAAYSAIIGVKGATIQNIQNSCSVRLDLDRVEQLAIVRGSPEGCAQAFAAIRDIVDQEGMDVSSVVVVSSGSVPLFGSSSASLLSGESTAFAESFAAKVHILEKNDHHHSNDELEELQAIADRVQAATQSKQIGVVAVAGLSKSALKRLRKKSKAVGDGDIDVEVDDGDVDTGDYGYVEVQSHGQGGYTEPPMSFTSSSSSGYQPVSTSGSGSGTSMVEPPSPPAVNMQMQHLYTNSLSSAKTFLHTNPMASNDVNNIPSTSTTSTLNGHHYSNTPSEVPSICIPQGKAGELLAMLLGPTATVTATTTTTTTSGVAKGSKPAYIPTTASMRAAAAAAAVQTANKPCVVGSNGTATSKLSNMLGLSASSTTTSSSSNQSMGSSAVSAPAYNSILPLPPVTTTQMKEGSQPGGGGDGSSYFKSKSGFTIRL